MENTKTLSGLGATNIMSYTILGENENVQMIKPCTVLLTPRSELEYSQVIIEKAARKSHRSDHRFGKDSGFVKRVAIKFGHESILEHRTATFNFIINRAASHQLVRHRIAAYTQSSQRFINYSKDSMLICVPEPDFVQVPKAFELLIRDVGVCYDRYKDYIIWGFPPETARDILPNCTMTEVVSTFNLRTWRHLFKERALNPKAQTMIRGIMQHALAALAESLPTLFEDQLEILLDVENLDVRSHVDFWEENMEE